MSAMTEEKTNLTAREQFEQLVESAYGFKQEGFQLTSEAEYQEVLQSIVDHKYLVNENFPFELSMDQALFSWYENVYRPMAQAIDNTGLTLAFPEATAAQLFLWVSRHYHFLKQDKGQNITETEAAVSYGNQFGSGTLWRVLNRLKLTAA